jgi:hypothetical protein
LFSVFYSLIGNLSHRHGKHEADSRFFIAFQDCFDFPHDSFQLFFLQNEKNGFVIRTASSQKGLQGTEKLPCMSLLTIA